MSRDDDSKGQRTKPSELGGTDNKPMRAPGAASVPTGTPSSRAEVDAFLAKARALAAERPVTGQRGRLIFAMDATMSRQPTWDMALALQGEMFEVVAEIGGLDVQLVYFRGLDECRASRWVSDATALARLMTTVHCRGGYTQIRKVLTHARQEAEKKRVDALVYVGDCMEEDIDDLCARAGELALLKVPAFLFQEGSDARAGIAFREIARLTNGAACSFTPGAAAELRALLRAVATYAAGGTAALRRLSSSRDGEGARKLLQHMKQR